MLIFLPKLLVFQIWNTVSFLLWSFNQVAGYSKGLEYFFGEDSGDSDAGAGLGVQLIDMQLRPLNFFSGTGDLMNMAWNLGSASGSSYPALQGIMLLHDHVQVSFDF